MSSSALIALATEIGAPLVRDLLSRRIGSRNADLAVEVGEAIARRANLPLDTDLGRVAQENPDALRGAIRQVEQSEAPEMIALFAQEAQLRADLLRSEAAETEPRWKSAWRPLMMYLIGFFWAWALVGIPVARVIGFELDPIDLPTLFQLTLVYLSLYMGGHTVKAVAQEVMHARR